MKEVVDISGPINELGQREGVGHWLKVFGPGLIVMLADTDAGCLITAAQSGAQWGYAMVLPQLLLIPILYMAQEMTVRLGIVTGKGHGELIRENFGKGWAWVSAATLAISSIGALLTEFVGVAGVGELFGVSKWITIPIATVGLIAVAFTGSYRRTEKSASSLAWRNWHLLGRYFSSSRNPETF